MSMQIAFCSGGRMVNLETLGAYTFRDRGDSSHVPERSYIKRSKVLYKAPLSLFKQAISFAIAPRGI